MDGDDMVAASGAAAGSAGAVETSAHAAPWRHSMQYVERLLRRGSTVLVGSNCDRRRSRSTPLDSTVA